jgi:hypothetical protein
MLSGLLLAELSSSDAGIARGWMMAGEIFVKRRNHGVLSRTEFGE